MNRIVLLVLLASLSVNSNSVEIPDNSDSSMITLAAFSLNAPEGSELLLKHSDGDVRFVIINKSFEVDGGKCAKVKNTQDIELYHCVMNG